MAPLLPVTPKLLHLVADFAIALDQAQLHQKALENLLTTEEASLKRHNESAAKMYRERKIAALPTFKYPTTVNGKTCPQTPVTPSRPATSMSTYSRPDSRMSKYPPHVREAVEWDYSTKTGRPYTNTPDVLTTPSRPQSSMSTFSHTRPLTPSFSLKNLPPRSSTPALTNDTTGKRSKREALSTLARKMSLRNRHGTATPKQKVPLDHMPLPQSLAHSPSLPQLGFQSHVNHDPRSEITGSPAPTKLSSETDLTNLRCEFGAAIPEDYELSPIEPSAQDVRHILDHEEMVRREKHVVLFKTMLDLQTSHYNTIFTLSEDYIEHLSTSLVSGDDKPLAQLREQLDRERAGHRETVKRIVNTSKDQSFIDKIDSMFYKIEFVMLGSVPSVKDVKEDSGRKELTDREDADGNGGETVKDRSRGKKFDGKDVDKDMERRRRTLQAHTVSKRGR